MVVTDVTHLNILSIKSLVLSFWITPQHIPVAFLAEQDAWATCGVVLHYLPTYSPELDLIEILWRFVKYHWLPLSSYLSYENLKNSVLNLLSSFGSEYLITFT